MEFIVTVPPNKQRSKQPVEQLAAELGSRFHVAVRNNVVTLIRPVPQLKNVYEYDERNKLLSGAYSVNSEVTEDHRILVFDDLYRSGATMNAVTAALYELGNAADIFALAMTRTRKNL